MINHSLSGYDQYDQFVGVSPCKEKCWGFDSILRQGKCLGHKFSLQSGLEPEANNNVTLSHWYFSPSFSSSLPFFLKSLRMFFSEDKKKINKIINHR